MHWSVIPVICPYLDMRSLYTLAAAYPQWAAMIFRQLEKKMSNVQLHLKSDVKCEYEVFWKVAKPQQGKSDKVIECNYTKFVELSNLAWKCLSFDLMRITYIRIDQGPLSSFPDEVYPVLGNIATTKLFLQFHNREEAKKILQAIQDHAAPFMDINDESREEDKEPLIRKSLLANVRTLSFSGYMVSLQSDLLAAMDADHIFLSCHRSPSQPLTRWVASVVEEYVKMHGGSVRCLRRGPEGYEFENTERMNADIIHILCRYLDLGSMFCLSAAYPEWSAIVHSHLKKKSWNIQLRVVWDTLNSASQMSRSVRVMFKAGFREWKRIPESAWKYVPFDVINVSSVQINQFDGSRMQGEMIIFRDEVYEMLSKVTTSELMMKFYECDTARRVLGTISLHPQASVTLVHKSQSSRFTNPCECSTLQHSLLRNCGRLVYKGGSDMLRRELKATLGADDVTLRSYLQEQAGRVCCDVDMSKRMDGSLPGQYHFIERYQMFFPVTSAPAVYVFKDVGRDEPGRLHQKRVIYVSTNCPADSPTLDRVQIYLINYNY